jgi:two-component system LytT family sensor kinase
MDFGLALITGLALYTRFRDSELRLAALEREWSAARLAALRMQLSPHTLFNLAAHHSRPYRMGPQGRAIHGGAARGFVAPAAERRGTRFRALSDELQFVRLYLELQQRRFADRLSVVLPLARRRSRPCGCRA